MVVQHFPPDRRISSCQNIRPWQDIMWTADNHVAAALAASPAFAKYVFACFMLAAGHGRHAQHECNLLVLHTSDCEGLRGSIRWVVASCEWVRASQFACYRAHCSRVHDGPRHHIQSAQSQQQLERMLSASPASSNGAAILTIMIPVMTDDDDAVITLCQHSTSVMAMMPLQLPGQCHRCCTDA